MNIDKFPTVAIIGRPNVGKSTLFNRIAGGRKAIVHDQPGVTRDRIYKEVTWERVSFTLVDTGGFDPDASSWDISMVTSQAEKAVDEADAVIFIVDVASGLTPADMEVAKVLRKSGKKVYLTANKTDNLSREDFAADFSVLGFHPIYKVSAEHGLGIGELLDAVTEFLPETRQVEKEEVVPKIAVVGRPNVGKSTLINHFLGEDRLIAHHEPGTTRDAVDTRLSREGKDYIMIDTAGIRRRGKVRAPVEKYSVIRAKKAISRSDICLLLMDATEMVTEQDTKIAGLVQEAGRGCIILVNKWDAVASRDRGSAEKLIRRSMPFMDYVPLLFVSAKTGLGSHKIFPLIDEIYTVLTSSIPTPALNRFLYKATRAYKPSSYHGKAISFGYMTQRKTNPPTFVILTNEPARVHFTYRRYLTNRLRQDFEFKGVPIVLNFRRKQRKIKGREP